VLRVVGNRISAGHYHCSRVDCPVGSRQPSSRPVVPGG
jgi:hypothetical protein